MPQATGVGVEEAAGFGAARTIFEARRNIVAIEVYIVFAMLLGV